MTIECPDCKTNYRLAEEHSNSQSSLQFRCANCGSNFSVPPLTVPLPSRPVPVQQHGEFSKRLRPSAPPPTADSLKATMMTRSAKPWLDANKVTALVVIDGPLKGQVFPILKPRVLLGRAEADIVLEDSEISRKHCAIEVHGTSAMVADLGSTNGTFVDDERIETSQLQHMSEFRLGSTVVMFSARAKD